MEDRYLAAVCLLEVPMTFRRITLFSVTVLLSLLWTGCEGNGGGVEAALSAAAGGGGSVSGSFLMISDNANNRVTVTAIAADGTLSNPVDTAVGAPAWCRS